MRCSSVQCPVEYNEMFRCPIEQCHGTYEHPMPRDIISLYKLHHGTSSHCMNLTMGHHLTVRKIPQDNISVYRNTMGHHLIAPCFHCQLPNAYAGKMKLEVARCRGVVGSESGVAVRAEGSKSRSERQQEQ